MPDTPKPLPRVAFTTVGCRLNQAETDAVQDQFAAAGFEVVGFDDSPDVHYINTCTVTGRADRTSRQWIHRARRGGEDAVILVAGCFANRAAEELAAEGEVDVILGQREKMTPLRWLPDHDMPRRPDQPLVAVGSDADTMPASVGVRVTGRSRAFLKVQDGCDHACTYCAVHIARGKSASAPVHEIKEAMRRVIDAGYEEVVFTGVDIADFHGDEPLLSAAEPDFISLVEFAAAAGMPRVRISSLEPWSLDPERVARLAAVPAWCEHIHLALQSGDPAVLRRMNRSMDLGKLRESMAELRKLRPEATVGCDIIAGFPGETDEAFANSVALAREDWVSYLHVFPFSPRPGTAAAKMKSNLDPETVHARAAELRSLSRAAKERSMRAAVGRKNELLVETDKRSGYSRNYLRANLLRDASRGAGKRVPVLFNAYNERKHILEAEEIDL